VTPSLVSLLSWDKPEIKFVLLKCILHIIDKRPNILDNEVKYFFIGFNEPFYIKYEKLEILSKIVDIKNQ
jgi:vesicle coat complex subunit